MRFNRIIWSTLSRSPADYFTEVKTNIVLLIDVYF